MDDSSRVGEWLREGRLLAPLSSAPSSVDLARALGTWAGADVAPLSPAARQIYESFDDGRQLVFVLVDGLGCNLLSTLPASAFLRRLPARDLRAVFPSTTAAVMTSLATGAWPGQHAAPGWFTYLPEHDRTATLLPFVDRFSGEPLEQCGIDPGGVFPLPPLARSMRARFRPVHPAAIAGSVYTRHHWGHEGVAYGSLAEGVDTVVTAARDGVQAAAAGRRTLHFLYIPSVDSAEHHHGMESAEAAAALREVDDEIGRLSAELDDARLVLSSDHDMITVPDSARHVISADDPLLELLRAPPSGEPRCRSSIRAKAWRRRSPRSFGAVSGSASPCYRWRRAKRCSSGVRSR